MQFNGLLSIRHTQYVRIDPRYLLSFCIGPIHNASGHIVPHFHSRQVASVQHSLDAPISPVELLNFRNGRRVTPPCPFATRFQNSPESIMAQRFIRANTRSFANEAPINTARALVREQQPSNNTTVSLASQRAITNVSLQPLDLSIRRTEPNVAVISGNTATISTNQPTEQRVARTVTSSTSCAPPISIAFTICVSSNRSLTENLDTFLSEQPSTSSGIYKRRVREVIQARKKLKEEKKSLLKTRTGQLVTPVKYLYLFYVFCEFVPN